MQRDLNDTLVFVKVIEQGSFIAAARALGLPRTTVSRKVQDLETRLGAQLLHRTTRKLGLTEAGAVYHEHCQRIARELDEAESAVSQLQGGPRGWLRFTTSYSIGITWIAPLMGEFHARHPEVRIEMMLTDERLDLIEKEIDVALRIGTLPDSSLVARRLASFRTQIYASPGYIDRHGEPLHPDELVHHATLAMPKHRHNGRYLWPLSDGTGAGDYPVQPILVANDPGAIIGALVCGEGLMLASDVTIKRFIEKGLVRRVLAGWTGPELTLNAVFPRGQTRSPKVRAFVDFLLEQLRFDSDYMLASCPTKCAGERRPETVEAILRVGADADAAAGETVPEPMEIEAA
ncbi:MAG TPA: LysR substrate-binding domain-containing protein [Rhodanobacteraceae bacterium]|nr:LysR substrate-binding domain-containing protein [Rhodanobacteraceae bacterium]